jgi:hypothetical protein
MTVDLEKHVVWMMSAAGILLGATDQQRAAILTACTALFEAGALAMREAILDEQMWVESSQDDYVLVSCIEAIDPATLKDRT